MANPEEIKKKPTGAERSPTGEAFGRIKASAVRYRGRVFTGKDHQDALFHIIGDYPDFDIYVQAGCTNGFVTTDYKFVDRVKALDIALQHGQIWEENLQKVMERGYLISEDLA